MNGLVNCFQESDKVNILEEKNSMAAETLKADVNEILLGLIRLFNIFLFLPKRKDWCCMVVPIAKWQNTITTTISPQNALVHLA